MNSVVVAAGAAGHGQGWRQVGELMLAFGLSSLIGLERELRRRSAGLRTQTIVGTTSALMILVSKYGFGDVLSDNHVSFDPSRVAAQVVSGVGFLGAGLILTRQGTVRGLTTAAAVWETAGIGMAAGAGLPLLACLVTVLHFVVVFGYTALLVRIPGRSAAPVRVHITYVDGQGVLRAVLQASTAAGWAVNHLEHTAPVEGEYEGTMRTLVAVTVELGGGPSDDDPISRLGQVHGVVSVSRATPDETD
jgi:putative Mg2+ transporter-C (MgtC) family protein